MTTFEQYLSEEFPLNKWILDFQYRESKPFEVDVPVARRSLKYKSNNGLCVKLSSVMRDGVTKRITLSLGKEYDEMDVLFWRPGRDDYEAFKQWLSSEVEHRHHVDATDHKPIHLYSLPSKEQYNQLIQPSLSV